MQATVNAKELKQAVTFVSKVIRKPILPILDCILLSAEDGQITVRATNLAQDLTRTVKADVQETGEVVVNAKSLKGYLSKVKGKGAVVGIESCAKLDEKPASIALTANDIRVTLPTLDPEDYPLSLTDAVWDHAFAFGPDNLKQIAKFADRGDSSRIVLKCVLVEVYNGKDYRYRLTTADGFRLVSTNAVEGEAVASYLLPVKAAEIIAGLKSKGILKLKADEGGSGFGDAEFSTDDSKVVSMLKEGKFPDYNQIIPDDDKGTWTTFDTQALTEKLESLATVSKSMAYLVKLSLSEGKAALSASDHDGNEAVTEIATDWTDEELAIGLNAKYLLDCLALCGERARVMFQQPYPDVLRDDGTVSQKGHQKAILIEGNDCQMVVMPMHIKP